MSLFRVVYYSRNLIPGDLPDIEGEIRRVLDVSRTNNQAAGVTGALAIRSWAVGRGMVAAPEALNVSEVDAAPAPRTELPQGELEMVTLWR